MYQWRRFQFFDKVLIKEPNSDEPKADIKKLEIQCATSGHGQLVFGDNEGFIHLVDRDFNVYRSFQAYARFILEIEQVRLRNILVTIGNDEKDILLPTIKMWNLDKFDPESGSPELVRTIILPQDVMPKSLAVTPDLTQLAVGLYDGTVITVVGDPLRERISVEHSIVIGGGNPVVGLHFTQEGNRTYLFAITATTVASFYSTRDDLLLVENLHEIYPERGVTVYPTAKGCTALTSDGGLVVGRNEAIYFYSTTEKKSARAFDGDRKLIKCFRNYLITVDAANANQKYNTVTVYDDSNKFIAYSGTFENVAFVLTEWNMVLIVCHGGTVYKLVEKDTQTKLDTLFRKNLYQVAIDMAYSNHYDPAAIVDIFREYGDHLYDKGDYDRAIEQYIKTIGTKGQSGTLEPSYVIKQFLDAQRIHNLTSYLEKLHEAGVANANHTTLLLNCYTKLKDLDKLNQFIKKPELNFDVETAIKVCLQAGYHEHALELAKAHRSHHWYIRILLEDLKRDEQAIAYIERLPFAEAEESLKRHGKSLLETRPRETTELLKKLCTNYVPVSDPGQSAPPQSGPKKKSVPDQFVHIFVDQTEWLVKFLEFVVEQNNATPLVYNTLLELYLRDDEDDSPEIKQQKRLKAYALISSPNTEFDEDHVLVLCQLQKYKAGQLYMYQRMELYDEIIQYHMENNEPDMVIKACKSYANNNSGLWMKALSYFANRENSKQEIIEILLQIEQRNNIPPMQILQILAQSKSATLDLVKDYIKNFIQKEQNGVTELTKKIKALQNETKNNIEEIQGLRSGAKIFQHTKCTRCQQALDLPALHFLCNHSYHQRCLGDNEGVCPECAAENADFRQKQLLLEENARKHNEFYRQLDTVRSARDGSTRDGFTVVAEYFGRGLFNRNLQENIADIAIPTLDGDLFRDLGLTPDRKSVV